MRCQRGDREFAEATAAVTSIELRRKRDVLGDKRMICAWDTLSKSREVEYEEEEEDAGPEYCMKP